MNLYDSELAALLGVQPEGSDRMRKNQNGTTTVDRTCTHCKEVYQRHLAPYVRVYEYDVCSGCAFAAWVIEQSHKTVSRVLH